MILGGKFIVDIRHRRVESPFVDFGCSIQGIDWRGERETYARLVGSELQSLIMPSDGVQDLPGSPLPGSNECIRRTTLDSHLEHRPGAIADQVGTRQAPGILQRELHHADSLVVDFASKANAPLITNECLAFTDVGVGVGQFGKHGQRCSNWLRRKSARIRLEVYDLVPCALQSIGEQDNEIARKRSMQSRIYRGPLVGYALDDILRHTAGDKRTRHELRQFVRSPSPQIVVATADVSIESAYRRGCHSLDVLVATVTGSGQHADPPSTDLQQTHDLADPLQSGRVVGVIEQHLERVLVVEIESTWCLEERRVECPEPVADVLQSYTTAERHRRRKHRILDVV